MFKSDKSKAVAAMFMAFMQCILLTLMCICVCSITVREMVGLWRPELSEIASKIQCVIAFVYFLSAFRKAFCRTNELQAMTEEMKRQNSVKDSDSPADAGEGEKDERNDEIRD